MNMSTVWPAFMGPCIEIVINSPSPPPRLDSVLYPVYTACCLCDVWCVRTSPSRVSMVLMRTVFLEWTSEPRCCWDSGLVSESVQSQQSVLKVIPCAFLQLPQRLSAHLESEYIKWISYGALLLLHGFLWIVHVKSTLTHSGQIVSLWVCNM